MKYLQVLVLEVGEDSGKGGLIGDWGGFDFSRHVFNSKVSRFGEREKAGTTLLALERA